jgi:hypothetical protein
MLVNIDKSTKRFDGWMDGLTDAIATNFWDSFFTFTAQQARLNKHFTDSLVFLFHRLYCRDRGSIFDNLAFGF